MMGAQYKALAIREWDLVTKQLSAVQLCFASLQMHYCMYRFENIVLQIQYCKYSTSNAVLQCSISELCSITIWYRTVRCSIALSISDFSWCVRPVMISDWPYWILRGVIWYVLCAQWTNALCVKPLRNLEIKNLPKWWPWLPFSQARIISDEKIWILSPFQFRFQFIFGYKSNTVFCSSKNC